MKKLIKILVWVAGVVVVLLILAIIGLKLFFPVEKARTMAVEEGSAALGRPLAIEGLDLSFWGGLGINLQNVTLGNPPDFGEGDLLRAEAVDVKLQIIPLISGEYRVDRLIINSPQIDMVKRPDGSTNFAFAMVDSALVDSTTMTPEQVEAMAPESKAAAVAVSFDQLEIKNGQLNYLDDSSGMKVNLQGLNLATGLSNPEADVYQSSGRLSIDQLDVTTDEPFPSFALGLVYDITYDMGGDQVTVDRADVEINGLKLELSGQASEFSGQTKSQLAIKSDRISVRDLLAMLSETQRAMLEGYEVDGEFSLDANVDYNAGRGDEALEYTGTAEISDMTMSRSDIEGDLVLGKAMLDFRTDNLRMNLEDATFNNKPIKGYLSVDNFDIPTINGELSGSVNLAYVQPFIPVDESAPVAHNISGDATFDIKFSGRVDDPASMNFSGDFSVDEGAYQSSLVPEPVESVAIEIRFDNRDVNVQRLEGRMGQGSFAVNGRISDLVSYLMADSVQAATISPAFDGNVKGNLNLAMLTPYLPDKGNPELSGQFDVDVALQGKLDDPASIRPRGQFTIADAAYSDTLLAEPIESFALEMAVTPETIMIKRLTAEFTSSDITLSGRMTEPFPYLLPLESIDRSKLNKPKIAFELTSTRFDVDKLFPEAVPGSGARLPTGEAAMDSVSIILLPDVDGGGSVTVDTLIYTQVEFTNLTGQLTIKDRKLIGKDFKGNVYSGTVEGESTIDLGDFDNPHYTGSFNAYQIEADDFMSRFTKFGGHLYGKADFDGSYDAWGWEPDAFINSLTANGVGSMKEGKLLTSGAVYSLLKALGDQLGQTFNEEQALKDFATDIVVKDGKVTAGELVTKLGGIGDITIGGSFGMIDYNLDYSGSILLSKELSDKFRSKSGLLGQLLGGSSERIPVPFKLTGPANSPTPAIDFDAIGKKASENLQDQLTNGLKGLLKKKK